MLLPDAVGAKVDTLRTLQDLAAHRQQFVLCPLRQKRHKSTLKRYLGLPTGLFQHAYRRAFGPANSTIYLSACGGRAVY